MSDPIRFLNARDELAEALSRMAAAARAVDPASLAETQLALVGAQHAANVGWRRYQDAFAALNGGPLTLQTSRRARLIRECNSPDERTALNALTELAVLEARREARKARSAGRAAKG